MWDWLNEMVEIPRWAFMGSGIVSVILALAYRDFMAWFRRRRGMARSRRAYFEARSNRRS